MVLTLMLSFIAATPSPTATLSRADDPPVHVWLSSDSYYRGEKARLNLKTAEDGYVVVLRADADGRVRVLFPLDPGDDNFLRGGNTIEVRSRVDREAFAVDEGQGTGVVLAARSATPFRFDEYVRGDHWDYRVLATTGEDKEAGLLDIVQRMAGDSHFDYDVASYAVVTQAAYNGGSYYPSYGVGFYGGASYGGCYDPYLYNPYFCGGYYDPFFYSSFYYGSFYSPYYYGFGYSPFGYRPFVYAYGNGRFTYRPNYGGLLIGRALHHGSPAYGGTGGVGGGFISRTQGSGATVQPRLRLPPGTLAGRAGPHDPRV